MKYFINYKNILTAQLPSTLDFLKKIISENNFETILEIGTNRGGLTLWLNDNKKINSKIYSFEIYEHIPLFKKTDLDGDLIIGNIFSENIMQIVKNLLLDKKQCLLLCDGGDKNTEFNLFSKFLKPNDVIMLHDYCDNEEEYKLIQQETGWPTPAESDLNSISLSIRQNNLEPYYYEMGKKNLWGSFIKK
jgi:hypothetical protein